MALSFPIRLGYSLEHHISKKNCHSPPPFGLRPLPLHFRHRFCVPTWVRTLPLALQWSQATLVPGVSLLLVKWNSITGLGAFRMYLVTALISLSFISIANKINFSTSIFLCTRVSIAICTRYAVRALERSTRSSQDTSFPLASTHSLLIISWRRVGARRSWMEPRTRSECSSRESKRGPGELEWKSQNLRCSVATLRHRLITCSAARDGSSLDSSIFFRVSLSFSTPLRQNLSILSLLSLISSFFTAAARPPSFIFRLASSLVRSLRSWIIFSNHWWTALDPGGCISSLGSFRSLLQASGWLASKSCTRFCTPSTSA
mmetsp:Transcript_32250/g.74069  ORF Transcript_32250/g.74069 Transcript_32250/m.74069 type:complete len:317 (+) Transcript_32250:503-1453(+)